MKKILIQVSLSASAALALLSLVSFAGTRLVGVAFLPFFTVGICLLSITGLTVLALRLAKSDSQLKQCETLLRNLPINITVADQSGRVLWRHSEKGDRNTKTELKNISAFDVSDEDRELLREDLRDTFITGVKSIRTIASLSRRFFFNRMARDIFGCETALLVSMDVSQLFEAERVRENLQRRYSRLLDGLLFGVMFLDRDGKILEINHSGSRILGFDSDEVIGMECSRVISPSFPDGTLDELIAEILKNGGYREFMDPIPMGIGQGRTIPVYLKIESLDAGEKTPEALMLFFRDCSAMEEMRSTLTETKRNFSHVMNLCRAGYFQYNPRTREVRTDERSTQCWPLRNGRLLPEEDWIHHDDLASFMNGRERLLSGTDALWCCVYRSESFNHTVWYGLKAMLTPDENGENLIIGTIQDISDLRETILAGDENALILRMTMKSLPCAFFIKDISNGYRYMSCSDRGYEFFGLTPEKVIGKTDFEVFGTTDVTKAIRCQDKAANEAGHPVEAYYNTVDRESGEPRHFHVVVVARPTPDGRKLLFGLSFDETKEEENRKKLQDLQDFYRQLLDHLPVAVLAKDVDNDFRYVIWNRLLEQHTGYSAERVIGKTDLEIEPYPGQQKVFRDLDAESLKTGKPMEFDQLLTTATGKTFYYHTHKIVLRNGEKNYTIETCLDVSTEKKWEQEQQNAITRLNEQIALASIVNSCLRRLNREPNFDQAIKYMLQIIGIGTDADRCSVYRYSENRSTVNCTYEWVREGTAVRKFRSMDAGMLMPQWDAILANHQVVKIDSVESLPPDQQEAGGAFLKSEAIRSMIVCGLFSENEFDGWIALDNVSGQHTFSDSDARLLSDVISILQLARQRKQIIDRIEENAALQKLIIDTITIPVVLLKPDFSVVHANSAALKMMGITLEDAIKQPCNNLMCRSERPPEKYCSILRVLRGEKDISCMGTVNGIPYTINATPILHHGRVVQILESFIDMSEVNKRQELLRKTARDAEAAAKAKSLFLSTMSHELRTPLNAVIGFSELLQIDGMSEQERQDALRSISLSGSVLLQLINDVLDLSKLESGQLKISLTPTDLRVMVDEMQCIFQQKLKENNLSFVDDLPESLPLFHLDGPHVRQILLNIIGNAVKFTPRGGVTLSVQFKQADADIGDLTIQIRDTGIGVSPDYIDKIFEPFVQQDSEQGLKHKGTGLGLPICKRLAEQMNGTLTLQSVLGRGSCFTLRIPNVRYEKVTRVSKKATVKTAVSQALSLRVLLVDDVAMNLKVLTTMARKLGAETVSANSGEAALEQLSTFHPDIILTDMWMPGMNGDELARRIHVNDAWKNIPVVVVTADTEFVQDKSGLFQGVLTKPITMARLRTQLQDLCEQEKRT